MKIAIIGTGLIGGSIAYKLRINKIATLIIGIDNNKNNLNKALELGIIDKKGNIEDIKNVDIIFLAIPIDAILETLPLILDKIQTNQIIVDVSSTKKIIAQKTNKHKKRDHFISLHPMWGTEYSGPEAAKKNAFEGKVCVICDKQKSNKIKLNIIEEIFKKFGMNLVYMNSIEHDLHTAYISHISHITSFALANTVLEKEKDKKKIFQLASSGFESTVRLAKSSQEMWTPVFKHNKTNILNVLKEHIFQLQKFEQHLKKENKKGIEEFIKSANRIKKIIK